MLGGSTRKVETKVVMVPYLSALYDAGISLLNTDDGSEQEYRAAMIALASACGVSIE